MADNPNDGGFERSSGLEAPSTDSGMSVEDAVASSYDSWDQKTHGISETERTTWGPELQKLAAHEGTSVVHGINSLVSAHINKRHGSPEAKRQALAAEIDAYQINPMPQPAAPDEFAAPVTEQPQHHPLTEDEASNAVQDFLGANPIANDPAVQDHMLRVAGEMQRQGYAPHLPTMLEHAIAADPRYSESARQAQEAGQVARAKAASVQVSGGGNVSPNQATDDLASIINELTPGG